MSALPEKLLSFKRNLHQQKTKAAAWAIIHDYFRFFNEQEWKEDLWQMLVGTLTSDQMDRLEKGIDRHNLFFFYEYTTLLLEAVCLLQQEKKKKQARQGAAAHISIRANGSRQQQQISGTKDQALNDCMARRNRRNTRKRHGFRKPRRQHQTTHQP